MGLVEVGAPRPLPPSTHPKNCARHFLPSLPLLGGCAPGQVRAGGETADEEVDAETNSSSFCFPPQGNEAQLGIQGNKGFQDSHPLPTSLGYLATKGPRGYLA